MTKRTTRQPLFLSFPEWMDQNPDLIEQEFAHTREFDCDECEGTGTIIIDDPHDYRFKRHLETLYNEQVERDKSKLAEWNRLMMEENRSREL